MKEFTSNVDFFYRSILELLEHYIKYLKITNIVNEQMYMCYDCTIDEIWR